VVSDLCAAPETAAYTSEFAVRMREVYGLYFSAATACVLAEGISYRSKAAARDAFAKCLPGRGRMIDIPGARLHAPGGEGGRPVVSSRNFVQVL